MPASNRLSLRKWLHGKIFDWAAGASYRKYTKGND